MMWEVRLYSAQVPAGAESTFASAPEVGAGRLFQVMLDSVQLLLVAYRDGPFEEPLVTYNRRVALWIVPDKPERVKRI